MIRLATEEDWPAISSISTRTGYIDYISRVGPSYLDDGEVFVYEAPEIQGFTKIEYMPDNSAWFSGLRVDPDYWRMGIGKQLTDFSLKRVADLKCDVVRMLVFGDNYRSLNLVSKSGFRRVQEYNFYNGVPDVDSFEKSATKIQGLVNFGWEFAHSSNGQFALYRGSGWELLSTNEHTFEILAIGDETLHFKEGGFTCMKSQLGTSPLLESFRREDFSSGFVLEKFLESRDSS